MNVGGGEYRWYLKGEQEARAKFEDQRELMLLFGEKRVSTGGSDTDLGSDGWF